MDELKNRQPVALVPPTPPAQASVTDPRLPTTIYVCASLHLFLALVSVIYALRRIIISAIDIMALVDLPRSFTFSDFADLLLPFLVFLFIAFFYACSAISLMKRRQQAYRTALNTAIYGPIAGGFVIMLDAAAYMGYHGYQYVTSVIGISDLDFSFLGLYVIVSLISIIMLVLARRAVKGQ